MKKTTLCYLQQNGKYLMLYRNKKKNDPNEGKWLGVGGKLEEGETPDECMKREVREETGLEVKAFHFYGVIHFCSDVCEDEDMYLYSCSSFSGTMTEKCPEGELAWIEKDAVLQLPLWEGDRYFLEKMTAGEEKISMTLNYQGDTLLSRVDNP